MSRIESLRLVRRPALLVPAMLVAALIGALAAGFFFQRASSQTPQSVLRMCVHPYTGGMRFLNYGNCVSPEYMVQWNQQGIQGPQGVQGDEGEQGPPGPPTYMDTYMITERHNPGGEEGDEGGGGGGDGRSFSQVNSGSFMASCQPGDELITGGYELIADSDMAFPPLILATRPMVQAPGGGGDDGDDGGGEGLTEPVESWLVSVQHDGNLAGVDVWAVCNAEGGAES